MVLKQKARVAGFPKATIILEKKTTCENTGICVLLRKSSLKSCASSVKRTWSKSDYKCECVGAELERCNWVSVGFPFIWNYEVNIKINAFLFIIITLKN